MSGLAMSTSTNQTKTPGLSKSSSSVPKYNYVHYCFVLFKNCDFFCLKKIFLPTSERSRAPCMSRKTPCQMVQSGYVAFQEVN